jgi:hypothetical protein
MSAAAGAAVQAFDGYHAYASFPLGGFAKADVFGGLMVGNRNRPVGEHFLIHFPFQLFQRGLIQCSGHIDRRAVLSEVEAHGCDPKSLLKNGGEQVLAAVLLHVIEAARPVNRAGDSSRSRWLLNDVRDAVLFIDHIPHQGAVDGTGVEGLAAGAGIERRLVQVEPVSVHGYDFGLKLAQVGVVEVKPAGHSTVMNAMSLAAESSTS